ncbi:MAG TPA: hypothetical protein VKE42_00100, partial [Candidatus Cybelea sp.]|nr:hypothetical protein [Candidatus Cybelea sp.]
MLLVAIFVLVLYAITYRRIGRIARRGDATAANTAATVEVMQAFFDALTPEAKARAIETKQKRITDAATAAKRADRKRKDAMFWSLMLVLAFLFLMSWTRAHAQPLYGD